MQGLKLCSVCCISRDVPTRSQLFLKYSSRVPCWRYFGTEEKSFGGGWSVPSEDTLTYSLDTWTSTARRDVRETGTAGKRRTGRDSCRNPRIPSADVHARAAARGSHRFPVIFRGCNLVVARAEQHGRVLCKIPECRRRKRQRWEAPSALALFYFFNLMRFFESLSRSSKWCLRELTKGMQWIPEAQSWSC